MARRSHHATAVGSISCDELEEVGAGTREGWLSDPSVHVAIHPRAIALARSRSRGVVLVLGWAHYHSAPSVKIRPALSPEDGELTAIEWVPSCDFLALAIGTSAGCLLFYSLDGHLIHKQVVHSGRVLRLRFREINSSYMQDFTSEELCVVMPAVIARFDGSDIQNLLKLWFQEDGPRSWDNRIRNTEEDDLDAFPRVPFQLWNISKYGLSTDAVITGLMAPPLLQVQSSQRHFGAVAIGDDAVISAYRLSEDRSRSLVGAILSKVMPTAFSTIASVSKMIWRAERSPPKRSHPAPQPFAKASPLTCLKDPPRKAEKITLSPSGTLAAITDSLGRILLLDTQALVVVRLWKGYREASCLFMEMLVSNDKASSSSTAYERTKNDYCLCLAIHAPRKEIIEIWKMRTGPRLLTIPCSKGSRILQPSKRCASSSSGSSYIPMEVFILNGDSGQLSVLSRSL